MRRQPATAPGRVAVSERRSYLLGGRRVAVRNLLEAGLLSAGQVLTFDRPRVGKSYQAVVGLQGALEVDGRSFATPSSAACTAAGVMQMDGWSAWATEDGTTLHELRARLLDSVADDTLAAGTTGHDDNDVMADELTARTAPSRRVCSYLDTLS